MELHKAKRRGNILVLEWYMRGIASSQGMVIFLTSLAVAGDKGP